MEQRPGPSRTSPVRRSADRLVPGARARAQRDALKAERDALAAERDALKTERKQLRGRLRVAEQDRDRLARRVGELELRDDLGYLFVVTYGRSGSTLLQGILNAIPGYEIRGENRQMLRHLHEFHRTGAAEKREQRRQERKNDRPVGGSTPVRPFYGMDNFKVKASLEDCRRLALDTVLRPGRATRVTGFKEIRWDDEGVEQYVGWLRKVFPGARFLLNTRDLAAVSQSKWWAEMPDALEQLTETEARLLALADSLGEDAFHVHYDDYTADPRALVPLFEWLGEEFDEARVRAVLDERHSY
jgi:hypothetical protein